MKALSTTTIASAVSALIQKSLCSVNPCVTAALKKAQAAETEPLCAWAIGEVLKNNALAAEKQLPACQDCGQAVLFVQLGNRVSIDGRLTDALNEGVRMGYGNARKSVCDPLTRQNTHDNTPAIIHYELVDGDTLTISFMAKGAGSENMTRLVMLTPAQGEDGIVDAVCDAVKDAGANPCPPIVLGIGIGGTAELAAILSKKALLRETGKPSTQSGVCALENRILSAVNALGIGAQGFGGSVTALGVSIETAPTHIGMLPVAINLQCHCVRHGSVVL